jgi:hypothetical protein
MKCKIISYEKELIPNRFLPEGLVVYHIKLETPYGEVIKTFRHLKEPPSDYVDTYILHISKRLVDRLTKIGIMIELGGNYPWVYLDKVNGKVVKGKLASEHNFTALFMGMKDNQDGRFADRHKLFIKVREMV